MATPKLKFKLSIDGKEFTGVLNDAGQRVTRFGDGIASSAGKASTSVQGLAGHLTTMGQAAAGAFAIGKLTAMTDAYASLNARVALASQGIGSAALAQQRLFEIAEKSRVGVVGLSEVYSTLSKAASEMGVSQQRVLGITETLSKAMTLSGGSAESARAAMVQFGQGLSAGTLRGEELNSVLEQAPRLAQALAEGLGKPVGALKTMAEQGQITTEAIFIALERMKGKIDTEFEQLPTTVGQAMTVMQNSLLKTIGVFDQAGGVSRGFADGIMTVSKNMDAAVIGAAAVGTAYLVLRNSTVAATVATQGLALAQGALGGPIGLIATALGVAATAWVTWKATATQSEQTVQAQVAESDADIVKRIQGQIDKLRERNQLAGAPIPKGENQNSLDAAGRYTEAYAKWQALISGKDAVVGASEQTVVALLAARNERIEQAGKDVAAAFSLYDNLNTAMTVDATAKTTASREKFMASYASSGEKLAKQIADYDKEFAGKVSASQRSADIAAIKAAAPKAAAIKVDESLAITARLIEQSRDRTEQFAAEGQGQEKLTEGQKLAIKITGDLENEGGKLNGTQRLAVMTGVQAMLTQEAKTIADKKAFDVEKQLNVMREKSTEEYIRQLDARALADADVYQMAKDYGRTVEDANARTQVEIGLMGETAAARQIALSQYDIEIKLQQKILDIKSKLASLPAQDEAIAIATAAAATEKAAVSSRVYVSDLTKSVDQYDNIFREGFSSMINGGKSAWKSFTSSLATTFKTSVADQIYKSFAQPFVVKFVASMLGIVGGGVSGAANAASAGGSVMDTVSTAGGITNAITSGFGKLASSSVGQSLGLSNSAVIAGNNPSAYIPAGGELTSFGATASSWASAIGGTMAGIAMGSMAKKMISGGYSAGKGMDTFQNIGIAVGSAIGGPVMGAIIGAGAGIFNRAFGRKLRDTGVMGEFGGDAGFSGQNYEDMKGGWFRSDKMNMSAMDSDVQKMMSGQFKSLQVSSALMAQTLGLSAESVAGFTSSVKLSFKDLTDEQIDTKITEEFAKVSDALAQGILGSYKEAITTVTEQIASGAFWDSGESLTSTVTRQITTSAYTPSEFAKEGETASQTLQRLASSITLVNGTSSMLGDALLAVGLKGANTASLIIDAFGGTESYAANMAGYYASFYTQAEQTAYLTETTGAAFAALGKTMPVLDENARDVYRAMVEAARGQDMTVEANRTAYASLVALWPQMDKLAPAFDSVADAAADAAATMTSAWASVMQSRGAATNDVTRFTAQAAIDSAFTEFKKNDKFGIVNAAQFETITQADFASYSKTDQPLIAAILRGFADIRAANATVVEASSSSYSAPEQSYSTPEQSYSTPDTSVADAIAAITKGLTDAGAGLGVELLKAQGKTVEAMAAQRAIDTAGYNTAQIALHDYNQTLRDQITAFGEVAAAKQAFDVKLKSLQQQYDDQTMTQAQKRNAEWLSLNAQDPTGQLSGLQIALWDLGDAATKTAKDLSDAATATATATATAITRNTWRDKLDVLIGARTQEQIDTQNAIAGVADLATVELILLVRGLEKTQAAAAAAAAAAKELADQSAAAAQAVAATNKTWQDQLDVLLGTQTDRSIALRDATEASTRALMEQVYAQQDLKTQTQAAKDELNTLTQSMKSLATSVQSAYDRIADITLQSQIDSANAANALAKGFGETAKSLKSYVTGEAIQPSAVFAQLLKQALAGDAQAMQDLPGAAAGAADFAKERSTNVALEQARIMADVMRSADAASLLALKVVDVPKREDPMVTAIKDLQTALVPLLQSVKDGINVDLVNKLGLIDTNLSNSVDSSEFIKYFNGAAPDSTLLKIFKEFDSDSSGLISKLEATRLNTLETAQKLSTSAGVAGTSPGTVSQATTQANAAANDVFDLATIKSTALGQASASGVAASQITDAFVKQLLDRYDSNKSGGWSMDEINAGGRQGLINSVAGLQSPEVLAMLSRPVTLSESDSALVNAAKVLYLSTQGGVSSALYDAAAARVGGNLAGAVGWDGSPANLRVKYGFANGGAFTNGVVSRPTSFAMGQMGEAGPEAIMPLANINGSLGVRFAGNSSNDVLVAEIRALRKEVAELRQSNTRENVAIASHAANTADSTRKLAKDGVEVWTDPASPINTKVAA